MFWLFSQTLFWLLVAFLFGLLMGWLLRGVICGPCRDRDGELSAHGSVGGHASGTAAASAGGAGATASLQGDASADGQVDYDGDGAADTTADGQIITDDMRPASLDGPGEGGADDLKRIKGVGPVIEKTLNGLGIYHFQQVADFTRDNVAWVDNYIDFPGRIDREGWISQAVDLAKGRATEFAQRYDRGEVGEKNPNR